MGSMISHNVVSGFWDAGADATELDLGSCVPLCPSMQCVTGCSSEMQHGGSCETQQAQPLVEL